MASSLKSRLVRLKERAAPQTFASAPRDGDLPAFLASWERLDEFLFRRSRSFPLRLPEFYDPLPFIIRLGRAEFAATPSRETAPLRTVDLRFFDFETTGLSGGAGTIAFLASTGIVEGDSLRIDQLFLADYPGEASFVRAFVSTLGSSPDLVSFNGKAFDWPLLSSRCVMKKIRRPDFGVHIDLVHTARRLWRPLIGSAALGELEGPVLGKERGEDIPGAEIPGVYFSYLEKGDDPRLDLVASHNLSDVANLAGLFASALQLFGDPASAGPRPFADPRNLGRIFIACGRTGEGEALLREAAEGGDERAALSLARRLRKNGDAPAARRALDLAGRGYESLLESARLCEGLENNLEAALDFARSAAEAAGDEPRRSRALARVRRLEVKLAEASRGRPGRIRS
ncbi:MAG TPA: ribonuclease H-like domain-containing protein [Rectinemataceae bacterium]|nr:ribonuclease H-like domain-containing protein [Rectinemataceae bacterium]